MNNFLIVGTQRTGSTALHRALNFHPDIACGTEWTQDVPFYQKLWVTEHALAGDFSVLDERQRRRIERVIGPSTRWLGYKLLFRSSATWLLHPRFSPSLWVDRLGAHFEWIASKPAVRVIHIVRKNSVEWLKSKYVSDRAKAWAGKEYPRTLRIEIPIRQAIRRLETKKWVDQRLGALRQSNPYLRIVYEDFLDSDEAIVKSLVEFLGCDAAALRTFDYRRHTRQSTRPAREYISNYDDLVATIRDRSLLVT